MLGGGYSNESNSNMCACQNGCVVLKCTLTTRKYSIVVSKGSFQVVTTVLLYWSGECHMHS